MRMANVILAGSFIALTVLATPALAKNLAAKPDEKSSPPSCHTYQQAADGSWKELPCEEAGPAGQTQHRPATRNPEEETH